jgi:hypothetical protein
MIEIPVKRYPTIFGFDTAHKVSARAIDIVYWIIITAAYCFAYHALSLILVSWNWFLVALTSLGVVGLPYCVKIILFGREKFPKNAALLCVFLSLLPTIFDFAGLYSETGLQDSLKNSKVEISQKINEFEASSKKSSQLEEQAIKDQARERILEIDERLSKKKTDVLKDINDANQKVIDEKLGVRAEYLTGKPGEGPRAKELQAEARRLQSTYELELKAAKESIERESAKVREQTIDQLKNLKAANQLIDTRYEEIKKQINSSRTFKELEFAVIQANGLLSTVASKVKVEYIPVEITGSDNIIRLSFSALLNLEITALVCLLLAFLMEVGDIVIVYVIRYEKSRKKEDEHLKILEYARKEALFKKNYDGY